MNIVKREAREAPLSRRGGKGNCRKLGNVLAVDEARYEYGSQAQALALALAQAHVICRSALARQLFRTVVGSAKRSFFCECAKRGEIP